MNRRSPPGFGVRQSKTLRAAGAPVRFMVPMRDFEIVEALH